MTERDKKSSEAARAAWLYYLEELTQGEVAQKLGVSRSTVIRLLQHAKDEGLVQISLNVSTDTFRAERDLERLYGLRKVRIVPAAGDEATQKRWLGHVAAEVMAGLVGDGAVIAVSWGTTLLSMADALTGRSTVSGAQIVALIGGLHNATHGTNPSEVAEQLGQFFNAPARALYAPVYVGDAQTAESLAADPGVQGTLDLARSASLVVCSLGTLGDAATMMRLGYIDRQQKEFLRRQGAVGEIACRWIDGQGRPVRLPPSINPIGISLDDLRRIPERLLVAGGREKRDVILAGLRGGYATSFVTDESTAAFLLDVPKSARRAG